MPSPMETLLRVQDSPVPTQTFFAFFGSSATAPIDCTSCSSNTGRYRVPPSSDFQTPPLAAATKRVIFPDGSWTPAIAEMRPLIAAEPILRAPKPEMVAELNVGCCAGELVAARQIATASVSAERVSLTSILSHRERRFLLPEGEGEDDGSDQINRGSDFTSKPTEKNFCKRMIEKNYFVAVVGK